jgi:uncharacterized RDD family membrane protein YckC
MEWFWVENGQQAGPVSEDELRRLVQDGRITDDTLVWRDGMANWQAYGTVRIQSAAPMPPPPPPVPEQSAPQRPAVATVPGVAYCSECGRMFPEHDLAVIGSSRVCAACRPAFASRPVPAFAVKTPPYAGMFRRLAARMFDFLLFVIPMSFILPMFGIEEIEPSQLMDPQSWPRSIVVATIVMHVVKLVYEIGMLAAFGATIGKKMVRVKVVLADGGRLTFGAAVGRSVVRFILSLMPILSLILWSFDAFASFDEEKRTLPDRICGTRCVGA